MNARIGGALRLLAVAGLATGAMAASSDSAGAREVIYNNIVRPLPGNFASTAFEATQTKEYGGEVQFARAARSHALITVAMSSWACQEGSWQSGCSTPKPKKAFKWPLTLNIYAVGAGGTVGSQIASVTKEFRLPYRPSASRVCAGTEFASPGAWWDEATNECFHGYAFTVTFHLPGKLKLPPTAILSVAYNTSDSGSIPQRPKPCDSTSAGCYYDSLNVADIEAAENGLTVGADPTQEEFVDSGNDGMYCGSSASLNTFGPTGACGGGEQPAFEVQAG